MQPHADATTSTAVRRGSFNHLRGSAVGAGVSVKVHHCQLPAGGWSEPYPLTRNVFVIVRRGGYQRCLDGQTSYVGPATAYFEPRDALHASRHPEEGGDTATLFFLSDDVMRGLIGDAELPTAPFVVPSELDLEHRWLLAQLDAPVLDGVDAEERLAGLLGDLMRSAQPRVRSGARDGTVRAHQRIVDVAREAITTKPAEADLRTIAAHAGHSVFHVSRVFRRAMGMTLGAFRNRVRVAMALDRLEDGDSDLASLAADLGFADQAHMSRVIAERMGHPPGKLRRYLTADRSRSS
jgi:AraC-like DNA-binding protein